MRSIRELASEMLTGVRGAGPENIVALCPFHGDTTPSFAMNIVNGLWLCYACGEAGNLQTFLNKMGVSAHMQEIKYGGALAEARRHKKKEKDPTRPSVITKDPLPEELLGLFRMHPISLLKAGFTEETLEYFQVGYDKWHSRITYPIRDLAGNLLGINGRAVEDWDDPRYKVYTKEYSAWGLPERDEVKKGTTTWHGHKLYHYTKSAAPPFIAVVEGYKACMWLWQAGVKDVVALQTRHMSFEQKWFLQKVGAPVHLMLDNNAPGWSGMAEIVKELKGSLTVKIVDYDTEQPDETPLEEIPDRVRNAEDYIKIVAS